MIFMRSRWRLERALIALEYAFLTFLVVRSVSEAWSDVAIFLGPFRINPSVTIVALMDVLAVVYLAVRWLRRDPLIDRFGTLFLLWVLSLGPWVVVAAVEWGIPGLSGAREWFRLLSLVLIYLTVWSIARHRGPTRVINACLLALPVPLVITYYQILTFATGERAFGPMVHPNNLAAFLVIMIVLTAWKLVQAGPNWTVRGLWTGLLGIELIALIAPVSSNGWLMLAAFLVAVFVFAQGRAFKRAGVATMVAFGLILLAVFTQNPRIQSEIWGNLVSVGIEAPAGETTSSNLEGRLTMWRGLFADWTRQPILGYGLNSAFSLNPITGKAAHSDYIRYLVEAGAFGLLFFVVFQVLGALELCRWRRWLADRRAHLMMTFAFGAFLAWIVGSLADNLISYTVFHVYFWSFLACATAVATTTAEPKVDTSNLPREAPDSDPPLRPSKIQRPRSLRGWLAPAASIPAPNDALDGRPCVGCGSRPRSRDNILCPRCLRPLLSWPKRLGLFVVVQALVGLMGVYLWSQGAGIETFVLGWLLWYVVLALALRAARARYLWALTAALLIGLVAVPFIQSVLTVNVRAAALLALGALAALALSGTVRVALTVRRHWRVPLGHLLPGILLMLGSLAWLARFALGRMDSLWLRGAGPWSAVFGSVQGGVLQGGAFPWPLPEALFVIGLLTLALTTAGVALAAFGRSSDDVTRRSDAFPPRTGLIDALRDAFGPLAAQVASYFRKYLLPMGLIVASAPTVNYVINGIADFLDGRATGLGEMAVGLLALAILLGGLRWALTQRRLQDVLGQTGSTVLFVSVLLHLSVWIATAALWGVSRLLPMYAVTERFAPLLHPRPIGLYTWISLAVAIIVGIAVWAYRKRLD